MGTVARFRHRDTTATRTHGITGTYGYFSLGVQAIHIYCEYMFYCQVYLQIIKFIKSLISHALISAPLSNALIESPKLALA